MVKVMYDKILSRLREGEDISTIVGTAPGLTVGDILPKTDNPIGVFGKYIIQTTGGDADIKSGAAVLRVIKGNLNENLEPFNADKFVSTSMNLIDPSQFLSHGSDKMYYFPVAAGVWGAYGTTQENNGYVIIGGNLADEGVYFSEEKPTDAGEIAEHGDACPYHEHNGVKYYLPPVGGWLCVFASEKPDGCHVAWSNYNDANAGTFGNSEINLASAIAAVHSWGLAGFVTQAARNVQDSVDLENGIGYVNCDRVNMASLTWTMQTVTTADDNNDSQTHYVFQAQVTNMATNGLCAFDFDGMEISGNVLNYSSTTINSVAALQEALGDSKIYFEKATPTTVTLPATSNSFNADDFGLTYFMLNGELVTTAAYVIAAYQQSGKDQLFNAVTYQKLLAEVVATALCQIDERLTSLENAEAADVLNLVVRRKFDMVGWRLVDAQPASATSPGRFGDYFIDSSYLYICVGANTWKKITISNF